jgi:threonylcarbamoyladenosine tRNA methylthiotransferase MtaB
VHIGSYGHDLDDECSLSDLLKMLVEKIPDVRFRLSSIEATQIDEQLLELLAGAPDRLAPHIHAPLQSGSDRILKLMGRRWYTAGEYRTRLERLSARVPKLGLGADVIVGFPGETDEDFSATQSLIQALPFTYLHVFPYSARSIAPSAAMRPLVEPAEMKQRSYDLRTLVDAKGTAYKSSRHDKHADVVLLRRIGGHYEGLTEDYLAVAVSTERPLPNRFQAKLRLHDETLWADPQVN